ncbi:MAG: hypothetical protein ABI409_13470 [Ramlibacter sp.]
MGMNRMRKVLLVSVIAAATTLASSVISGRVRAFYPGSMDCALGCEFVAGGWPFPYLVDHPAISPTGSVSLVNGLLGVDIIWFGSLAATYGFWLALFAAFGWAIGRSARHGRAA